jgi:hypothetical protein
MRPIGVRGLSKSGPGIRTQTLAVTRTSRVSVNLIAPSYRDEQELR